MSIDGTQNIHKEEQNFVNNSFTFMNTLIGCDELNYTKLWCDFGEQNFKLQGMYPGQVIKLHSTVLDRYKLQAYVFNDSDAYKFILREYTYQGDKYYIVNHTQHTEEWHPVEGLYQRLYYSSELPEENYLEIMHRKNEIEHLSSGKYINIFTANKNKIYIVRRKDGDYMTLMANAAPNAPLFRVDAPHKERWYYDNRKWISESAWRFLERIKQRNELCEQFGVPYAMQSFITETALRGIFYFIFNNWSIIQEKLTLGESFRISVDASHLEHSLNIVRGENGEWMLMVEINKALTNYAIKKTSVHSCFRLDIIEEWVDKCVKDNMVFLGEFEALLSQRLLNKELFNVSFLGERFYTPYGVNISQFSPKKQCDLFQAIHNYKMPFTVEDKFRMTQNLLEGLAWLHNQNKIHQDIKSQNLFISQDEEGYHLVIADFGSSIDNNVPNVTLVLATKSYESPEILMAYQNKKSLFHSDFWGKKYQELGRYAVFWFSIIKNELDELQCNKAHPANDMWAAGIVKFELDYNCYPDPSDLMHQSEIQKNKLLSGLLSPHRSQRLTAKEACKLHKTAVEDFSVMLEKMHNLFLGEQQDLLPKTEPSPGFLPNYKVHQNKPALALLPGVARKNQCK